MNEYVKNLNRMEFVITTACTGKCKHCSQGDHADCVEQIDVTSAKQAIQDVCQNYDISCLMTFGGEPLLYPETVCEIHRTAMEMGIARRDLITNGFFSKNFERIQEVAQKLKVSGVNRILLSVDAFHQETIPLEPVKYFAERVKKEGIFMELSPAWVVSKEDNNAYNIRTREVIAEFDSLEIPVGQGNIVFPSGNALKYLKEYFPENVVISSPYEEDPTDIRTVSFSANGDVLNGNIYEKRILEILEEYQP